MDSSQDIFGLGIGTISFEEPDVILLYDRLVQQRNIEIHRSLGVLDAGNGCKNWLLSSFFLPLDT